MLCLQWVHSLHCFISWKITFYNFDTNLIWFMDLRPCSFSFVMFHNFFNLIMNHSHLLYDFNQFDISIYLCNSVHIFCFGVCPLSHFHTAFFWFVFIRFWSSAVYCQLVWFTLFGVANLLWIIHVWLHPARLQFHCVTDGHRTLLYLIAPFFIQTLLQPTPLCMKSQWLKLTNFRETSKT